MMLSGYAIAELTPAETEKAIQLCKSNPALSGNIPACVWAISNELDQRAVNKAATITGISRQCKEYMDEHYGSSSADFRDMLIRDCIEHEGR